MPAQPEVPLPLILVAHHARDTVDLLKALLEREGFTVLCAYNGRAALQYARQHQPALLLLDQALPLLGGLEVCRVLRKDSDTPSVFILSDRPDQLDKLLAFAAGADEYLSLPAHPRELLARVQAVLRRARPARYQPRQTLRYGEIELDTEQRQARVRGEGIDMTGLEYELLAVFLRHPGRVFSREELLARLNGFLRGDPFERAIDIHVSNLRRKLRRALGDAMPIETVRGVGYRLCKQDTDVSPAASPGTTTNRATAHLALDAFNRAPVPLIVLASDRTVLLYNEAARQLCGWRTEEVAGQVKCYSLLLCHRPDGTMLCHETCVLRTGNLGPLSDQQARYTITVKDGREIPVEAFYTRLDDLDTESACTLLTLQPELATAPLKSPAKPPNKAHRERESHAPPQEVKDRIAR